jgi:hypothetical protein
MAASTWLGLHFTQRRKRRTTTASTATDVTTTSMRKALFVVQGN